VVLCLADAIEYGHDLTSNKSADDEDGSGGYDELRQCVAIVKDQLPRALLVQPLLFDADSVSRAEKELQDFIIIPPLHDSYTTTIKGVMSDVSARFLAELSTYARSIQEARSIPTPAGTSGLPSAGNAKTPRPLSLLRTTSLRADRGRSGSPQLAEGEHDINGLPELTEVESAPAEFSEYEDSQMSSPRESMGTPELGDSVPAPRTRQVSRDSSVDSLARRELDDGKKHVPNPRRSLLRSLPSPAEVAERRLKGRQILVIGSLYLQAGRWSDALRELNDGVLQARANDDHFWHAKGLENVIVTMLLLAKGGMNFQIPETCYATTSKTLKRSASTTVQRGTGNMRPSLDTSETLSRLAAIIPDLCRRILEIHTRGFANTSEVVSRHAFSEIIVRLARLLVHMRNAGGVLSMQVLDDIIFGTKTAIAKSNTVIDPAGLTRLHIAEFLFRAFPLKTIPSPTSSVDTALVLAGMSSVLGELGLDRKQAMVNKELLAALVVVISQARRIDLSVFGLVTKPDYPDVSSDPSRTVSTGMDANIQALMDLTGRAYALVQQSKTPQRGSSAENDKTALAQETINEAVQDANLQSYGSLRLKLELLRLYSNVGEVIPDYAKVVSYTAAILDIIGPHSAPSSRFGGRIKLPKDEQIRHFTKIQSAVSFLPDTSASRANGLYWDPFLIRKLELLPPPPQLSLLQRSLNNLKLDFHELEAGREGGPFLHEAFAKTTTESVTEVMLVSRETVEFVVSLQNLYDFEVVVESLSLFTDGVPFAATSESTTLPPRGLHRANLRGRPLAAGKLHVLGCKVKIQGCREEDFFLVEQPWSMTKDIKIKASGLPQPDIVSLSKGRSIPQTKAFSYDVLESQPMLSVVSSSLPPPVMSLLDGESHSFNITVHNDSTDTDIDFVHLSFEHGYIGKRASPLSDLEQYETDYQHIHRPIMCCKQREDISNIVPGASADYQIEVHARLALRECRILFDYAHLRGDLLKMKKKFFTRQSSLPVTFKISPSIEPISYDFISMPYTMVSFGETHEQRDAFVWVLNVRNAWVRPLHIITRNHAESEGGRNTAGLTKMTETVQPGHVVRLSTIVPKLYVEDTSRPIPSLTGGSEKQFVVSKTRRASNIELNSRELFWYREELLKQISVEWKEQGSDRCGEMDLRSVTLKPQMLDIIKRDAIHIKLRLTSSEEDSGGENQLQGNAEDVEIDSMLSLTIDLTNKTQHDVTAFLRVSFELGTQVAELADTDVSHCLAWSGQLEKPLQTLTSGQGMMLEYGLTALSAAQYVANVTVLAVTSDGDIEKTIGHSSLDFSAR